MLELAVLGLLQTEPLNGYRLKQRLELFLNGCINANYGAIYPLLKRLQQKGCIEISLEEERKNGFDSKVYRITEAGQQLWLEKMLEHPQESWVNARSRFMIKFFFFTHLKPSQRLKLLESRLMVCQLRLESQDFQIFPPDPYQQIAFERFQEVVKNEINWLQCQIKKFNYLCKPEIFHD